MSVGSPTAGTWSSSQWRPDNEFETDRLHATTPRVAGKADERGRRDGGLIAFPGVHRTAQDLERKPLARNRVPMSGTVQAWFLVIANHDEDAQRTVLEAGNDAVLADPGTSRTRPAWSL